MILRKVLVAESFSGERKDIDLSSLPQKVASSSFCLVGVGKFLRF